MLNANYLTKSPPITGGSSGGTLVTSPEQPRESSPVQVGFDALNGEITRTGKLLEVLEQRLEAVLRNHPDEATGKQSERPPMVSHLSEALIQQMEHIGRFNVRLENIIERITL